MLRHTLVKISLAGRERIHAELARRGLDAALCGGMLLPESFGCDAPRRPGVSPCPLPGIVRRDETQSPEPENGRIPVGFVHWACGDFGRLRLAAHVLPHEVIDRSSPCEVLEASQNRLEQGNLRSPALLALNALRRSLPCAPLRLGVWGSAALELYTDYYYTHAGSDLDMLLEPCGPLAVDDLARVLARVEAVENEFQLRIDAELTLAGAYGISLKELMGPGKTVLGKGRRDVRLFPREEVWKDLQQYNATGVEHGTESKNVRQGG